jgi:hypothetical protein
VTAALDLLDLGSLDAHQLEVDERTAPLSFARLWHRPPPRTSQRDSIRAMLEPGKLFAFLLGGNRSGKTESVSQLFVALGLGREHHWVSSWCRINGVDQGLIPKGPGIVWCVSGDSNDSRRFLRPKMAKYLGETARWRNHDGNGEAEAVIETERGPAKWVFKSVDQGRDGFQGDSIRACGFDEEPLDNEVVEESMFRIVDQGGRLIFSMTPLYGWTKLLQERVREPRADTVVRFISGEDNPHLDQVALQRSLAATSAHLVDARAHGRITTAEGLVYRLDRSLHVVRAFDPPREWPRYLSIDFGTRNPAAWVWGALDPQDDVLHIYREHYQAGWTTHEHWEANRGIIASDPKLAEAIADPEDLNARMQLAELGLETRIADKDIRGGIDAVSERLALDANGKPGLVIHDCCRHLVQEFEGYRWPKQKGAAADGREQPVKKDDHALDALRYMCLYLKAGSRDEVVAIGSMEAPSYWR